MAAKKAELIEAYRQLMPTKMVDDVIDPRETRPTSSARSSSRRASASERPWKRHGVVPV